MGQLCLWSSRYWHLCIISYQLWNVYFMLSNKYKLLHLPPPIKDLTSPQCQPNQTHCTAGGGLLTWCAGLWARAQACHQNSNKRKSLGATVLKQGSEQQCK